MPHLTNLHRTFGVSDILHEVSCQNSYDRSIVVGYQVLRERFFVSPQRVEKAQRGQSIHLCYVRLQAHQFEDLSI